MLSWCAAQQTSMSRKHPKSEADASTAFSPQYWKPVRGSKLREEVGAMLFKVEWEALVGVREMQELAGRVHEREALGGQEVGGRGEGVGVPRAGAPLHVQDVQEHHVGRVLEGAQHPGVPPVHQHLGAHQQEHAPPLRAPQALEAHLVRVTRGNGKGGRPRKEEGCTTWKGVTTVQSCKEFKPPPEMGLAGLSFLSGVGHAINQKGKEHKKGPHCTATQRMYG